MLLAIGAGIRIFYEIATETLLNRMHHMHFVVKLEIRATDIWLKRGGVIFEAIGDLFLERTDPLY